MSKRKKGTPKISKYGKVYFVLGTRAQFLKVAPLMRMMMDRGLDYTLVYTAQHQENIAEDLDLYGIPQPDIVLYHRDEASTKTKFLSWFLSIIFQSVFKSKRILRVKGIVLTHGDTFTTWTAAVMAKLAGCKVGHLESGYRSFNLRDPFPEEISRVITFYLTDVFFCPNDLCVENVKKFKGEKINTRSNSVYDGLSFVMNNVNPRGFDFMKDPYVLVSLPRYENIFTSRLEEIIIPQLQKISKKHKLVVTLYPALRERLKALDLFDDLDKDPNVILHKRFQYVDFVNVLEKAQFVINDGGSIQQELSFLGVPTILFRKESETKEGFGRNIVLSKLDESIIDDFVRNYKKYRYPLVKLDYSPSKIILNSLYE